MKFDAVGDNFSVLNYDQVNRLNSMLNEEVSIGGRSNFPPLEIQLKKLILSLRNKLSTLKLRDIRLNGGAANYVILPSSAYHDMDLIFGVDLSGDNYDRVRAAVLELLRDLLPSDFRNSVDNSSLKSEYISKMIKVNDDDKWCLISLSNRFGRNVELKFVEKMRRQFEFSVDSFQIILDPLLNCYNIKPEMVMDYNCFPSILAESVFGNFAEAYYHLQKKLIATKSPENIRGGGLLKYCHLLVQKYQPDPTFVSKQLEKYMCSRFFIDFTDIHKQRTKLESYLTNHFIGDEHLKLNYLNILHNVIRQSTVCLMGHERRQTLQLIEELAYHVYYQDQHRYFAKHQYDANPFFFSHGNSFYCTPYVTTHHQPPNCFACHCSWMTCS